MDLFDKLATERGFPTKRAQTDYARKLYEMLKNVQATLEDLLGFFEVHRYLTGQINRAENAKFLEVASAAITEYYSSDARGVSTSETLRVSTCMVPTRPFVCRHCLSVYCTLNCIGLLIVIASRGLFDC
ncbi:unnamed protein product [Prorocentrum cordatum]|uniref:Component of oligomeric Golgi complex 3 n=1 Tax=Prorocentrum cordatum TaxID=2364126 RepID=A0ABN9WH77_9DINO|nr:unnamed protein product [Polarella glacialis]